MGFDRPFLLLLLILVPLYVWLRIRWHRREIKALRLFVRPVLWDRVVINPPPRRTLSMSLWAVSLSLLVISAGGPCWGRTTALTAAGGSNLVVALDVSRSMESMDELPSRIARASSEIERLAMELDGVRIALVLFAGSSRLAVPLTMDREFLVSRLPSSTRDLADVVPGTRLGDVVELMCNVLPDMDLESNLGIIFSDGGFHDYAIESAADAASRNRLRLIAVGVGGPLLMPVPAPEGGVLIDAAGDTVRTMLEEESLRTLAERTGGVYMRISGPEDIVSVVESSLEHISGKAAAAGGSTGEKRYQYFLAPALLLLLAAVVLERRGL